MGQGQPVELPSTVGTNPWGQSGNFAWGFNYFILELEES